MKIKLKNKINELNNNTLINLYCIILSFNLLEFKNGNEYDKAQIRLKYVQNMLVIEHINIFKILRTITLFEFLKYFKTWEDKYNKQNIETKVNINDYLEKTENISQEIIITMVFKIQTTIKEVKEKEKFLLSTFDINEINTNIFKM
jgi:hypothetical protein